MRYHHFPCNTTWICDKVYECILCIFIIYTSGPRTKYVPAGLNTHTVSLPLSWVGGEVFPTLGKKRRKCCIYTNIMFTTSAISAWSRRADDIKTSVTNRWKKIWHHSLNVFLSLWFSFTKVSWLQPGCFLTARRSRVWALVTSAPF